MSTIGPEPKILHRRCLKIPGNLILLLNLLFLPLPIILVRVRCGVRVRGSGLGLGFWNLVGGTRDLVEE